MMKVSKTNFNEKSSDKEEVSGVQPVNPEQLDEEDLDLIGKYSRVKLDPKEIYSFNITLCDNEIDRDNERFDNNSLEKLAKLFEGKTGLFDHSIKAENQNARVYKTWVETDESAKTSFLQPLVSLKAKAYMVKTDKNKDLIKEIEAGIKKEVSVSCSVENITCSVCGADMRKGNCQHIKGKTYQGKKCHAILQNPTDAYEWSFVAVPAQKNAGVTKNYNFEEKMTLQETINLIKSANFDLTITKSQLDEISEYIGELENSAKEISSYRAELIGEIEKYATIAMPKVKTSDFVNGCKGMGLETLKSLRNGLLNQANETIPMSTQIKTAKKKSAVDQSAFQI